MTGSSRIHALSAALRQRLDALGPHLGCTAEELTLLRDGALGAADLLARIAERLRRDEAPDRSYWLLLVALTGSFPTDSVLKQVRRSVRLASENAWIDLLVAASGAGDMGHSLDRTVRVVSGDVVVDVDFCAKYTHNTGIQRVVRQTMARWVRDHEPTLVAWADHDVAFRELDPRERSRVVDWGAHSKEHVDDTGSLDLIVPVDCDVVLPEVARAPLCDRLAALAEYSGNRVALIGYDTIPIGSADVVPPEETERFTRYLSIVKHAHVVAGISDTASEEFRGFVRAIRGQGLEGPTVVSVPLPIAAPDRWKASGPISHDDEPLVLVVGSQEPRKNQLAVLHAAELVWQRGVAFRLRLIGGGSAWFTRLLDRRVRRLRSRGRHVEVLRGVDDEVLADSYHRAACTVFPSLHEGYGLPVGESLALGVPAITSDYGATAEVARGGGCILVDPRDDHSIADAIEAVLTDADLSDALRRQARRDDYRSWDDYAATLWDAVSSVSEREAA